MGLHLGSGPRLNPDLRLLLRPPPSNLLNLLNSVIPPEPPDLRLSLSPILGFSDDEALRKQVLFELVLETFRSVSAGAPEYALWVPGRLEIFGKHTDYGGGHTLVAPVPRGFALVARPRSDAVVALHDASRREQFLVEASGERTRRRASRTAGNAAADPRDQPTAERRQRGQRRALTAVARSAKVAGGDTR